MSSTQQLKPTSKQLRYLRYLAEQTGSSFAYPRSAAEARREIERLRGVKTDSRSDIRRERRQVADDMATRRGDAAQVHASELTGYGSSATWTDPYPAARPTEKQLAYLRHLADQAGEESSEPETLQEASREIERLKQELHGRRDGQPQGSTQTGPRVVHCKREHCDVYIGRPSKWGNPFKAGRDGTREQVIARYERWIQTQPQLLAALPELRGKVLGCWCAPRACHGEVLLRLTNSSSGPLSPSAPTSAEPGEATDTGARKGRPHRLLCYQLAGRRRLIVVQRIRGRVRVGDLPADGKGARYLVADGLERCGELDALIADYVAQVHDRGWSAPRRL
jgi:hypothetical protein